MNIKLKNIGKKYEGNSEYTLQNINLDIESKDFVVILGPSGCGKTTLLRMIAGLNSITKGDLLFDGKRVNELSPVERGLAMVFQSYALYPQLSVFDNIAFGLKVRKVRKDVIYRRVMDVAKILQIEEYLHAKPKDLSGGQRQRVAIGRAIARKPEIFLMDEPLSNLDAKLREEMRTELIQIHQMVGTTTIYVTHDQLEAMTMATKIILIDKGVIQQADKPLNLYLKPNNMFVANFIGSPTMNMIDGKVSKGIFTSKSGNFKIKVPHKITAPREVVLGFRSEDAKVVTKASKEKTFDSVVEIKELLGKEQLIHMAIKGAQHLIISESSHKEFELGAPISIAVKGANVHLFDKKTTNRIKINGTEIQPINGKVKEK